MSEWDRVEKRNNIQTQALNKDVENAISDKINIEINELESRLMENLNKGFPNDDAVSHRLYHEKVMLKEEKIIKLKDKVVEKVVTGIIWAVLVGIVYLVDSWHITLHK